MRWRRVVLGVMLGVAACASPSRQIATKLGELGVPQRQAECVGTRLEQRLSTAQLRRLFELARLPGERAGRMSIPELAGRLNDRRDPLLVAELLRAGIGCAI